MATPCPICYKPVEAGDGDLFTMTAFLKRKPIGRAVTLAHFACVQHSSPKRKWPYGYKGTAIDALAGGATLREALDSPA